MSSTLNFSVSFRGSTHHVSLDPDTPLSVLQAQIQEQTGVPPELQKLIFKGKKTKADGEDATIAEVGIKNGVKIQLLGTTSQELDGMKAVEGERERRERIMRERAMKPQYKVHCSCYCQDAGVLIDCRFARQVQDRVGAHLEYRRSRRHLRPARNSSSTRSSLSRTSPTPHKHAQR